MSSTQSFGHATRKFLSPAVDLNQSSDDDQGHNFPPGLPLLECHVRRLAGHFSGSERDSSSSSSSDTEGLVARALEIYSSQHQLPSSHSDKESGSSDDTEGLVAKALANTSLSRDDSADEMVKLAQQFGLDDDSTPRNSGSSSSGDDEDDRVVGGDEDSHGRGLLNPALLLHHGPQFRGETTSGSSSSSTDDSSEDQNMDDPEAIEDEGRESDGSYWEERAEVDGEGNKDEMGREGDEERPALSGVGELQLNPKRVETGNRLTVDAFQDWHLMNPLKLEATYLEFKSLKNRVWVEGNVLATWLVARWKSLDPRQRKMQLLPLEFLHTMQTTPLEAVEIARFRTFFDLPAPGGRNLPYQDLVCVLNGGKSSAESRNHYFVVVFMPVRRLVCVLGKDYTKDGRVVDSDDWDSWNGKAMWRMARQLMGWQSDDNDLDRMKLFTVDWKQNGVDCGPMSAHLVQHLFQQGMPLHELDQWTPPVLPCYHVMRMTMARELLDVLRNGSKKATEEWDDEVVPRCEIDEDLLTYQASLELVLENIHKRGDGSLWRILRELESVSEKCRECHQMSEVVRERRHEEEGTGVRYVPQGIMVAVDNRRRAAVKGCKSAAEYVSGYPKDQDWEEEEEEEGIEAVAEGEEPEVVKKSVAEVLAKHRRMMAGGHCAIVVGDWNQANIARFPRPRQAPPLPDVGPLSKRQHPFSFHFDDYSNGPTSEVLAPVHDTVNHFDASMVYYGNKVTIDPWNLFKDYGFRIMPNFAQNFYLGPPCLVKEHLCPVGLPNPPRSITAYHPQKASGRLAEDLVVTDQALMSLEDLLHEADKKEDEVLLTGMTEGGNYVVLDLERDGVYIPPQQLLYSCDIDSVIWITRKPKFSGPCLVSSGPVVRDQAPIWKHNHVTVSLLYPQSPEDVDYGGGREDWWEKPSPLSNIPHMLLATIPGASLVEVIMFFPRMKHQDPHRRFWRNRIPADMQGFFWDKILLPTLDEIIPKDMEHLYSTNRKQAKFKQGKNKTHLSQQVLQPQHWDKLVEEMGKRISHGPDDLDFFGSFFFVVQIKGCKRTTHTEGDALGNNLNTARYKLEAAFNALDWEYMRNRDTGELFLDIGITVCPSPTRHPTNLVGLWRLDCLEASFGAAGYRKGTMHTINTLSMYGALQAEAPPSRARQSHVAFRSSYPQAYEATRQQNNSRSLFDEKEVYNRTPKFLNDVAAVRDIYNEVGPKTTYGVRDEFRIGGSALEDVVDCINESVKDLHESRPVLWLPSERWFSFLSRRLGVLEKTHRQIWMRQPPNYGVLSGLFAFLMQSVIFTPPIVNTYVRESLGLLRYQQNTARFGMFFLDTLDLNTGTIIPEILDRDDALVYRVLGECREVAKLPMVVRDNADDTVTYPLGEMPSWGQVRSSIKSNPTVLIRQWEGLSESLRCFVNQPDGSLRDQTVLLFIDFTNQIWNAFNRGNSLQPDLDFTSHKLEEALNKWSVDFVLEYCAQPSFLACNTGIFGKVVGRPALSFSERRKIFFPNAGDQSQKYWEMFMEEPGYIHRYWTMREDLLSDECLLLEGYLEELLEACQCLPESHRSSTGSSNKIWRIKEKRVCIATNPTFYSIKGISANAQPGRSRPGAKRSAPAHATRKDTMTRNMIQKGFAAKVASQAYAMKTKNDKLVKNAKRSGRSKNKRQPPQKKPQGKTKGQAGDDEEPQDRPLIQSESEGENEDEEADHVEEDEDEEDDESGDESDEDEDEDEAGFGDDESEQEEDEDEVGFGDDEND